jgi:hypothetical protein
MMAALARAKFPRGCTMKLKVLTVIITLALVGLAAFVVYDRWPDGDDLNPRAQPNPQIVTPQTETEAERRTRLCEAALQGGEKTGILMFCTKAPTPTPALPGPPAYLAEWCWFEKASLAHNQVSIDNNKAGGYDFRAQEEEQVTRQRNFESTCGSYQLVPTPSDSLDEVCQLGRDNEYKLRQAGATYWADEYSLWHDTYCR